MGRNDDYFNEEMTYGSRSYEDDMDGEYAVNPLAESTLNVVAVIVLVIGILSGLIVLFVGILSDDSLGLMYGLIAGPAMFLFCGLLPWACIKVVVNMSRNLYAIREELHELKNR
jgi:hypothetical protein